VRSVFDVEAVAERLLPTDTTKGIILNGVIERGKRADPSYDPHAILGEEKRFLPFLDYSSKYFLPLVVAAAKLTYPRDPQKTALRKLAVPTFAEVRNTRAGSIVFDALGSSVEAILLAAPKSYRVFSTNAPSRTERIKAQHVRVYFENYRALMDSYDVGILEGALIAFDKTGTVTPKITGPADGYLDVEWE
jgi:uncharacterized protein (TIGR02265 family)